MITQEDFTRINNDGNGNPRYVCHYTHFTPDADSANTTWDSLQGRYARAVAVASKLGGRKFHNKQFVGGVVFQCYNLRRLCDSINATMADLNAGKARNPARNPGKWPVGTGRYAAGWGAKAKNPGKNYEVTVDNVGCVHRGNNLMKARREYAIYVDVSKKGIGRAGGESVVLWQDGEPIKEHMGTVENPRRNPSSGAKQRARGSRTFTSGLTAGDVHAMYVDNAEMSRRVAQQGRVVDLPMKPYVKMAKRDLSYAAWHRPKLPNPGRRGPTGPRGTVSADDVRELVLYIENDAGLYRQQYMPIVENLRKKKAKGKYDHEKAVKLVCYLTDAGAKKYGREIAGDRTFTFNVPTRTAAAREILSGIEAEYLS